MTATTHALRDFRLSFAAMLAAAERVRVCVEAESGTDLTGPADVIALQRLVAAHYRMSVGKMLQRDRHLPVVRARQIAMALCRQFTPHTVEVLGAAFAGRDHGTIAHASRQVRAIAETEPRFAAEYAAIAVMARDAVASRSPA